mmetsp:Transcript_31056/g.92246  ORF Transcript_31056/g.92246 Transcript_31056/m.92246 type:complete len:207 (-) Transcript_31056:286-906(-)
MRHRRGHLGQQLAQRRLQRLDVERHLGAALVGRLLDAGVPVHQVLADGADRLADESPVRRHRHAELRQGARQLLHVLYQLVDVRRVLRPNLARRPRTASDGGDDRLEVEHPARHAAVDLHRDRADLLDEGAHARRGGGSGGLCGGEQVAAEQLGEQLERLHRDNGLRQRKHLLRLERRAQSLERHRRLQKQKHVVRRLFLFLQASV